MNKSLSKLLIGGMMALGLSGIAAAAPACGASTAVFTNQNFSTGTALNFNGDLCSIGSYTFSNFYVFGQTINTPFVSGVNGFNFSVSNPGTGVLELDYSNIGTSDIQVSFQISPGVVGMTLKGVTSQVTEVICATPASNSAANNNAGCSPAINSSPLFVTVGGSAFSAVTAANKDYVFKDILGGSENQQVLTPEPVTFSLMGVGLLGLGLIGRRIRK
jgi:hypothetical protein